MEIKRDAYLKRLVEHRGNQRIKIVTGIRRCGKSYLLFHLFKEYLLNSGVSQSRIIEIQLDDRANKSLRDPDTCLTYIRQKVRGKGQYYLLIDEVQMMDEFEDVLNSCLHIQNLDTYVTGSNSHLLSKDVITEFRGRGDEMYLRPLNFTEFATTCPELSFAEAWRQYYTYGGLPYCALLPTAEEKAEYLMKLFEEVYLRDIVERYGIQGEAYMDRLLDIISSGIGSLTNPTKLERAFNSAGGMKLSDGTIKQYLDHLTDAFIVERAERYDIKGKRYISTPYKYYFTDTGLRNARINFRQIEETHLMENIIYNELCGRGYLVDVGVVEVNERQPDGKYARKQIEVDFVCNKADERIYVQSALTIPTTEKRQQEERPLTAVQDSFRKVIITADNVVRHRDEQGILIVSLQDFLNNTDTLESTSSDA
ncbi:MAG: ATP-binding protein [Bacteroidales bacterium]|nr:ATP-binding protein [Bacteroidales bacterium]